MRRRNKMTNPYCEKHEWPAGMGKPCPDCAELDNARRALNIHADAVTECKMVIDRLTLEGVKLRTENKQLQIDMGTVKQAREMADRAMASARTWQETANEKIKEVEPLQAENAKLRAELELAKKFHTDEYKNRLELTAKAESLELQNEALRKALLEIKAKLERSHDGGCILPLRDMVNDALGEGVAEKPNDQFRQPRGRDILGAIPDFPEPPTPKSEKQFQEPLKPYQRERGDDVSDDAMRG